ncbi:MAG: metalloregulator ArsR/SmtB family transcription factor [Phycisphaerales bacterium]|nr:metalloregulator ArsR/SmtB family transcription factor [Phycisphaerales bacterium]
MERNLTDLFAALADPTRREILILLTNRCMPAGEIARRFPQQRPAISKHLTILKRAGLLDELRQRQRRIYSIRKETLRPIARLLDELISHADENRGVIETKRISKAMTRYEPTPRVQPNFDLEFD